MPGKRGGRPKPPRRRKGLLKDSQGTENGEGSALHGLRNARREKRKLSSGGKRSTRTLKRETKSLGSRDPDGFEDASARISSLVRADIIVAIAVLLVAKLRLENSMPVLRRSTGFVMMTNSAYKTRALTPPDTSFILLLVVATFHQFSAETFTTAWLGSTPSYMHDPLPVMLHILSVLILYAPLPGFIGKYVSSKQDRGPRVGQSLSVFQTIHSSNGLRHVLASFTMMEKTAKLTSILLSTPTLSYVHRGGIILIRWVMDAIVLQLFLYALAPSSSYSFRRLSRQHRPVYKQNFQLRLKVQEIVAPAVFHVSGLAIIYAFSDNSIAIWLYVVAGALIVFQSKLLTALRGARSTRVNKTQ